MKNNVKILIFNYQMTFNDYLKQFTKNIEDNTLLTHISFNGGKFNVKESQFDDFYKQYYNAYKLNEELFIIEKLNENPYAFFLDIEIPKKSKLTNLSKENLIKIIEITQMCMKNVFGENKNDFIVSKRMNNYHINFYNIIVNMEIGKTLSKYIIGELPDDLKELIDSSVYRTGLRLFGSKKIGEELGYKLYNLDSEEYYKCTFELFEKTIIRRKKNHKQLSIENKAILNKNETVKKVQVKGITNVNITTQIEKFLEHIKTVHDDFKDYTLNIQDIVSTQNKMGVFCYYIGITDKFCPFKNREHQRKGNPLYIELNIHGVSLRCRDEMCLHYNFPDIRIELHEKFSEDYPELYLSMSSKYWKSDIVVSPKIKKLLEDSLSGSHYKIAKVIFHIYKDNFRIDDLKSPEWYEYDGHRWKKSYIMNILLSEELQKYYKSIKISDTEVLKNSDLTEFIQSKDKLEANLRNDLVDNIIKKLENVSFKKNILNEMYYLFKQHEPNFVSKLDSNPYLIGFKNGVFDLEKYTFREGKSSDYITFSTGYDYIEYTPVSLEINAVNNFLQQIIPNKKVFEYLMKVLGNGLSGINDEKFYIFSGFSGANGKSTLINFLENALGDYGKTADVSLLTNKKGISSNASPDIIRLKGARKLFFQEPEATDTLQTSILKTFSGGDTIVARELFKSPISFKLQSSMFMSCNIIPKINSNDGGIIRRLRVINFNSKFCSKPKKINEYKIDPTIKTKIKTWRPYLMSILIHYYKIYQDELKEFGEIEEPKEVLSATDKYMKDNDKFNDFFTECLEENEEIFTSIKDIYQAFIMWYNECNGGNPSKMPSQKDLENNLKIKFGDKIIKNKKQGFNIEITNKIQNNIDEIDYDY